MLNKIAIVLCMQMIAATASFGQLIDASKVIQGGISDGEKILKVYLYPFEKSLNTIGRNGIIDFSENKHKVSFSIGVSMSGAITPVSDRTYDFNDLALSNVKTSDLNNSFAQTYSGNNSTIDLETTKTYQIVTSSYPYYKNEPIYRFKSPEGKDNPMLILPILTLGIYSQGSSLNLRMLPKLKIPNMDGSFFSYGISLQHNLKQYINPIKKLPFDILLIGGIQYANLSLNPNLKPDETKIGLLLKKKDSYDNQKFSVYSFSVPLELTISKAIKTLHINGGIGYNIANSTVEMTGKYPIYISDPLSILSITVINIDDPINFSQTNNHFYSNLGLMYRLHFVKISLGYSFSKYDSFNFSIATEI